MVLGRMGMAAGEKNENEDLVGLSEKRGKEKVEKLHQK